jgi:NADH-quinone oxidoreductase subunit L
MSAVLLVPLLPLITALIVGLGSEATRHARAKIAAWPIGAAFCGAIATLYVVATEGPIALRLYESARSFMPTPSNIYSKTCMNAGISP